jgi:hypothetical protein
MDCGRDLALDDGLLPGAGDGDALGKKSGVGVAVDARQDCCCWYRLGSDARGFILFGSAGGGLWEPLEGWLHWDMNDSTRSSD